MKHARITIKDNQVFYVELDFGLNWIDKIKQECQTRGIRYPHDLKDVEIEDDEYLPEPTPDPPVKGCCG